MLPRETRKVRRICRSCSPIAQYSHEANRPDSSLPQEGHPSRVICSWSPQTGQSRGGRCVGRRSPGRLDRDAAHHDLDVHLGGTGADDQIAVAVTTPALGLGDEPAQLDVGANSHVRARAAGSAASIRTRSATGSGHASEASRPERNRPGRAGRTVPRRRAPGANLRSPARGRAPLAPSTCNDPAMTSTPIARSGRTRTRSSSPCPKPCWTRSATSRQRPPESRVKASSVGIGSTSPVTTSVAPSRRT